MLVFYCIIYGLGKGRSKDEHLSVLSQCVILATEGRVRFTVAPDDVRLPSYWLAPVFDKIVVVHDNFRPLKFSIHSFCCIQNVVGIVGASLCVWHLHAH